MTQLKNQRIVLNLEQKKGLDWCHVPQQHETLEPSIICDEKIDSKTAIISDYRRIFVYTFCLINMCLSLSDDANKIKILNIERA